MSRRWLRAACALAALLVAASPLSARQTDQELLDRIRVLRPQVDEARAAAEAIVQARREAERTTVPVSRLDTISVGPVRVLTVPGQEQLARGIFRDALDHFGPWLDENGALKDHLITFQWASDRVVIPVSGPHRRLEADRTRSRDRMVRQARVAIGSIASNDAAPSALRGWFAGPVDEPEVPEAVYRVLASFPADLNKRCLAEGGRACWTALGLDVSDEPVVDWYTPRERRELVRDLFEKTQPRLVGTERGALVARCLDGAVDVDACDATLAEFRWNPNTFAPLAHNDARPLLVYLALQAGGDGAWDRLVADPDMTRSEALQAASGLSPEELGDLWRDWVVSHRPAAQADLGMSALTTILTILAFAAMAMRSTKWRLG